jgi:hypothetical protein
MESLKLKGQAKRGASIGKEEKSESPAWQQKPRERVDLPVNNKPTKRKVEERTQRRYNITTLSKRTIE